MHRLLPYFMEECPVFRIDGLNVVTIRNNRDYFMNLPGIQELSGENCAVLVSGGLDSAILIGQVSQSSNHRVFPLFIRCGLLWEKTELTFLEKFLLSLNQKSLEPLVILDAPVGDLYGPHWSITGVGIPDANSHDEAVFLPGRNILLSSKALLWCHLNGIRRLALGVLGANPFPDSSDIFFEKMAAAVNEGVKGKTKLLKPYCNLQKSKVLHLGGSFPLQHTFSCINPMGGLHCGICNKCAERIRGFKESGIADPTEYFKG